MVTLRADPWSPDYGGDVEATLAAGEGTEIQVDPTIETADWSERDRAGRRAGRAAPVRRRRAPGRAAGARRGRRAAGMGARRLLRASVRSAATGRATFERPVVGRILALGAAIASAGPRRPRSVPARPIAYRAIAVPGDDPEAPLQVLQNEMREAEGRLAAELAPTGLVLADGPLHYPHGPDAAVVGIAKRMVTTYLVEEPAALLPRLHARRADAAVRARAPGPRPVRLVPAADRAARAMARAVRDRPLRGPDGARHRPCARAGRPRRGRAAALTPAGRGSIRARPRT